MLNLALCLQRICVLLNLFSRCSDKQRLLLDRVFQLFRLQL